MSIEYTLDKDQMNRIVNRLRNVNPIHRANIFIDVLKNMTNLVDRKLKFNLTGFILSVRSGNLRNSIGSRIVSTNNGVLGIVGSGVRTGKRMIYANILETGGVIVPKNKQWLTIPTEFARTPSGVGRFTAPDVFEGRTRFKGAVILDNVIFGINPGKGSKITPLFILKKSVKIPPKRYMSKTLEQMQGRLLAVMSGTIERALASE